MRQDRLANFSDPAAINFAKQEKNCAEIRKTANIQHLLGQVLGDKFRKELAIGRSWSPLPPPFPRFLTHPPSGGTA